MLEQQIKGDWLFPVYLLVSIRPLLLVAFISAVEYNLALSSFNFNGIAAEIPTNWK